MRWARVLAALLLALADGACASAPPRAAAAARPVAAVLPPAPLPLPELTFRSGEPPRRAVVVEGVFAAPAATAATLDGLSRRLSVPVSLGQELLGALAEGPLGSGLTLSRAQVDQLDPARPIAFVALTKGIGVDAGSCVAVTFKDAAGARRSLDEMGRETSRQGGESARRLPSGPMRYAGVHGRTLLVSGTPRTIAVAGPLAEELQERRAPSTLTVTFHPHVVMPIDAAAVGPILEARVPAVLAARKEPLAAAGFTLSPPFVVAAARLLFEPIVQSRAITLTVELTEDAGLSGSIVIEPVAESAFARSLAQQFPFAPNTSDRADGSVASSSSAGLLAWGGFGDFVASMAPVISASGPRGRELRASSDAFLAQLQGTYSCAIERGAPLGWRCAWPLRSGAKSADVLRRYAAFVKSSVAWSNEAFGMHIPPPIVLTKGAGRLEQVDIERRADPLASPGAAALLGGSPQRSVAVVRGGALVVAQGSDPRAVLDAPIAASAALDRARGANFVASVDIAAVLTSVATASVDPQVRQGLTMIRAIPGLETLRLPLVVTGRSGATARYELQLPPESLQNAARVIAPYMGVMGGTPRP